MTHSVSATLHGVRYRLLTEHLADLLDTLLAGEVVSCSVYETLSQHMTQPPLER